MRLACLLIVVLSVQFHCIKVEVSDCESGDNETFTNIKLYRNNKRTFQIDIEDNKISDLNTGNGVISWYKTADLYEYRFQTKPKIKVKTRFLKAVKKNGFSVAFIVHRDLLSECRGKVHLDDIMNNLNTLCIEGAPVMVGNQTANAMFCCKFKPTNRVVL